MKNEEAKEYVYAQLGALSDKMEEITGKKPNIELKVCDEDGMVLIIEGQSFGLYYSWRELGWEVYHLLMMCKVLNKK